MLDRTHNNPPDPIDEALAPYGGVIEEAQNWLDGTAVENEAQMKAVDQLLRGIKDAHKAVSAAEESEAKPIYDQWKAAKARFAPTLTDLDRIKKGLVSIVDAFKRKLAAEKAEAERKARAEAEAARRVAEEAARAVDAGDIEAMRAADAAMEEARRAQEAAQAASKDTVKGLRTVHRYEITDHRAALHDIAANDREAITAFIEAYVAKSYRARAIAGVRTWSEKEAF
jgi:hypothetical protein